MRAHELRLGRSMREVLLTDYVGWSMEEIASDLGISDATLRRWMRSLGIGSRRVIVDLHAEEPADGAEARGENAEAAA